MTCDVSCTVRKNVRSVCVRCCVVASCDVCVRVRRVCLCVVCRADALLTGHCCVVCAAGWLLAAGLLSIKCVV